MTQDRAEYDSGSPRRTSNNVMRHKYRELSEEERGQMEAIKDAGLEFHNLIEGIALGGGSRELSIAKTKIEEAVMWGVKHVTG